MSLTIGREDVDRLAEQLASAARVDKSEAVRMALADERQRREATLALRDRSKPIQDKPIQDSSRHFRKAASKPPRRSSTPSTASPGPSSRWSSSAATRLARPPPHRPASARAAATRRA
ncbi:type II toxin-antitoxin system VapB family antitoxin [Methylobacterium nigriterrae]|uniref:type II toxin-antitoxin system VapB family antitoxin n=1 Tax=Methylobacterium nigriterrae TaxID=3127512 RepID=UPI00301400ED